jgi:diguanylate cyclase (GGDEF)-like protein
VSTAVRPEEMSDIFHNLLHETLPASEREWSVLLRFSPTVEQAFLRYHTLRTRRWVMLATLLFGGFVVLCLLGVLLLNIPTLSRAAIAPLLFGGVGLPLVAASLAMHPAHMVVDRLQRLLNPVVVALPLALSQVLLFQQVVSPGAAATAGLFQSIILTALVLRLRFRHSLPLMVLIAVCDIAVFQLTDSASLFALTVQAMLAIAFGLLICYLLEYDARRDFISQARIYRVAATDSLSKALNRHAFLERGQREIDRACRYRTPVALLLLDIDHFKQVNDRYGHAAGDRVIAMVGQICAERIRSTDLLGRIGGEEFVLLLPDTDIAAATHVAERLRVLLAEKLSAAPALHRITASIGVAALSPGETSLHALMERADACLYAAKHSGRDRVVADLQAIAVLAREVGAPRDAASSAT